jgi:hypothetical protein
MSMLNSVKNTSHPAPRWVPEPPGRRCFTGIAHMGWEGTDVDKGHGLTRMRAVADHRLTGTNHEDSVNPVRDSPSMNLGATVSVALIGGL